jgi:hypothetical protein
VIVAQSPLVRFTMTTPFDTAVACLARGRQPIPVPHREKNPGFAGWERLRLTQADLPRHFNGKAQNVGVLNGMPSGNEVDVDAPEALVLADWFLPPTGSTFGRASKPRSHRRYRCDPAPATARFKAPNGTMLVELLSTGTQSLWPGSVNPSGEIVTWHEDGEPAELDSVDLRRSVAELAAAALLARAWPATGSRHDFALALAGFLLRQGAALDLVRRLVGYAAQAAGDEEAARRVRDADDTAEALADARPVTGGPTLARMLPDGDRILAQLGRWLGFAVPASRTDVSRPVRLTRHTGGADWPADADEDRELPPVPPFPVDVLPGPAHRLVSEGARALGCPPDALAVPLLTFTAGVMGRQHKLRLKPSWELYALLWAGLVMPPGSIKTPALNAARAPIDRLQKEARDRFRDELRDFDAELAQWSAERDKARRGEKPERPRMEHYFSTDSTTEAIAKMLESSPGFTLTHDELSGWVRGFDAYRAGRGGDRQRMLSMWGAAPLKVDRKGDDPIIVYDPAASVFGTIQPDVLSALSVEAGRSDGFLERFLWSYPDSTPAPWNEAGVSEEAIAATTRVFRSLRTGGGVTPVILHPQAKQLFIGWHDENARLTEGVVGLTKGMYAKLPQQWARLCLILHALAYPEAPAAEPVSTATASAAIELIEYFRQHAHRTLTHFGAASSHRGGGVAVRALRVLERAGGDWLSRRALHEALGGHVPSPELAHALEVLAADGQAERRDVPPGPAGGRPGEEWRATTDARANEQTDQTSGDEPVCSVDSFARTVVCSAPTPERIPGWRCPNCRGLAHRVRADGTVECQWNECQRRSDG